MWRALTYVLLLYMTLDFSDPNLPGALNFDLSQSVDGVHTQVRGQLPVAKPATAPAPPTVDAPVTTSAVEVDGTPGEPRALRMPQLVNPKPRAHLSAARSSSSTDPH
jgi:hypothetical protein